MKLSAFVLCICKDGKHSRKQWGDELFNTRRVANANRWRYVNNDAHVVEIGVSVKRSNLSAKEKKG